MINYISTDQKFIMSVLYMDAGMSMVTSNTVAFQCQGEEIARADPEGVALRWAHTVQRRTYSVSGPNALWHIDGLRPSMLFRWGIIIHGY
jgi:hypothetical protein